LRGAFRVAFGYFDRALIAAGESEGIADGEPGAVASLGMSPGVSFLRVDREEIEAEKLVKERHEVALKEDLSLLPAETQSGRSIVVI
jgi:hypothetical protein